MEREAPALTNQPLILNDADQDPRHFPLVAEHIEFKVKTLLGVPMPIKDQTMGVLEAVNKHNGSFNESDAALLSVIAAHAAIAINNARLLKARQQALEKVRAMNEVRNNFLALASHELRTPLGIIIGYATFLQSNSSGDWGCHLLALLWRVHPLLDVSGSCLLLPLWHRGSGGGGVAFIQLCDVDDCL